MSGIDVGPNSEGTKIADYANQCLEAFQRCLFQASSVHPREFSKVEDQVARFHTWSTSLGIFAPGRASADHRLRYAPEVYTVIVGLLEALQYRTRKCSDAFDVVRKSTNSMNFGTSDEALERVLHDVATELSHLNKISNVVRRASKEARDVKGNEFQIKNDDGDNVEDLLTNQFLHYIQDRYPGIDQTLQQRLSRTMLLRRKRILYRRHRQEKMAIQPQKTVSEPPIESSVAESTEPGAHIPLQEVKHPSPVVIVTRSAPSQIRSATTLVQEKFDIAARKTSVFSASNTVPLNKHETLRFPPAPGFVAKQGFERLRKQRLAARISNLYDGINVDKASVLSELEEASKMDLLSIGEIICPYCLDALPAKEVFEERRWRDHVVNDLEPYICLVENCTQPEEIYTHSDSWISHLHQHSQRWRCSSHHELGPFSVREDYIQHLRDAHSSNLSDTKLRALADRNARNTVEIFQSCPLCGSDENGDGARLLEHITGHLRSLALMSLPSYHDEVSGEVRSEENSFDDSHPLIEDVIDDTDDVSSLDLERLEIDKLDSRNFLGGLHHDLEPDDRVVRDVRADVDGRWERNPTKSLAENDHITSSSTDVARTGPESLTLEEFLRLNPTLYWKDTAGVKGPAIQMDYARLQKSISRHSHDEILRWSPRGVLQKVRLVTEDDHELCVYARIMRPFDVAKFKREADRLSTLRHRHIQTVIGSYSTGGSDEVHYGLLVFPPVADFLEEFLWTISEHNGHQEKQNRTWFIHHDAHKLLPYFACLSRAVSFLHERPRPIRHGDIKAENIFIDRAGSVILAEFNISGVHEQGKEAVTYGSLDGTILYSPKDVWKESPRDGLKYTTSKLAWDVVSLGFVFLEMATVLFGKTLTEMRETMRRSPKRGTIVSYAEALRDGEIKTWLGVLRDAAADAPWKLPKDLHRNYVPRFLSAIEDMITAEQDDQQALRRTSGAFEPFSTHC